MSISRIAAPLLLLLIAPFAQTQELEIDFDDREFGYEYCKWMSLLAKDIMTMRQDSKPMSQALPIALERVDNMMIDIVESMGLEVQELTEEEKIELQAMSEEPVEGLKSVVSELVIGSYDMPVYSHPDNRREAINETENQMFGTCYKGFQEELSLE